MLDQWKYKIKNKNTEKLDINSKNKRYKVQMEDKVLQTNKCAADLNTEQTP